MELLCRNKRTESSEATEKKMRVIRRRALIEGAASVFDISPSISIYYSARVYRPAIEDKKNLTSDWMSVGASIRHVMSGLKDE